MKKLAIAVGLLLMASPALAAVTVSTAPTSLVTSPITVGATSAPVGLFSFSLSADATETLSSVSVTLNAGSGSTVSGSDIASLAIYRDNNSNGTFESDTDLLAGSQATVNVGSATSIPVSSNNDLAGGATFFVAMSTGSSWSGVAPADSVTVTLGEAGIVTSANSPTVTAATTAAITATAPADTTGPVLMTAIKNSSGTIGSVVLTFGEATTKPTIDASNINTVFVLNNSHSWLDGASAIGSATWSSDGKVLTVVLSNATSNPTVAVGDSVTVAGSVVKDVAGNNATGSATITAASHEGDDQGDEEGDEDGIGRACANSLMNGRLYKIADRETVYLAANCMLKPFRGEAVFHARGEKFRNITVLSSLPTGTVTTDPALPASGTLIKGSDKTVWFVETGHKRKGFASEQAFLGLGFKFSQVNQISDTDLNTMSVDNTPIVDASMHPDGAIVKCTNSNTVFQVIGQTGEAFANVDSFELRGHTFAQVASIDCGRFHYVISQVIDQ